MDARELGLPPMTNEATDQTQRLAASLAGAAALIWRRLRHGGARDVTE